MTRKRPPAPSRPARRAPIRFGPLELTGRTRSHVVPLDDSRCALHPATLAAFVRLRSAARRAGFELAPASGFRDFATQLGIWNGKWTGQRPLLDRAGRPLAAARLRPAARVRAILLWSAPPGASRHHWGSDLDVYDRAALAPGGRLLLIPAEYAEGGPFAALTGWLDVNMGRFGFYRPYRTDRGGVQPEPWHLSHWPTAREASRRLRIGTLRSALAGAELEGRRALLAALPGVYGRYVRAVDRPPASCVAGPAGSSRPRGA